MLTKALPLPALIFVFIKQQKLYMALGGIPHYLEKVKSNLSAGQNIAKLCFVRDGQLFHEFEKLFSSLFDKAEAYIELINIIASKKSGLVRNEIAIKSKLSATGGTLTERLNALEQAGFIKSFIPIGYTTKGHRYKLIDEYCLFYLTWIKPVKRQLENEADNNYWLSKINSPKDNIFLAFGSFFRQNTPLLK